MPEASHYQHYELLKRVDGSLWELGRGAIGITYKAYDNNLHCPVALKVINPTCLQSAAARQQFLREARAAATVRHQNVASMLHAGSDHGNYFYATEFVDGQTVEQYVSQRGRLRPAETLDIALQVAQALTAVARQQLVLGSLKPANLVLVDEDGAKIIKVIDFGLVKGIKREGQGFETITVGDGFVGTPLYASPEQLEEWDIDIRSDIYSLGVTLYYLVTGRAPFSGSVAQVMSQHLYKPVPMAPLQGCPVPFVNLILSMMEKDREKRPQNPVELRKGILRCREALGSVSDETIFSAEETKLLTGERASSGHPEAVTAEKIRYQHYELLKRADGSLWELSRGATGITYKAYDNNLCCPVALKVINAACLQSDAARQRFLREARVAAAVRHQNVASMLHAGSDHGNYFYATEFVDGQTVEQYLSQKGKLSPLENLDIALPVTRALAAAARQHLVHGDLKPAHVMLVDEDGEQIVKVIDFGLAQNLKGEEEDFGTERPVEGVASIPHFASPERLEQRDIDIRSDIYSLGVMLYYLATGRPPFSGSRAEIRRQHLHEPVPKAPLQGYPVPFVNLILSMMQKDPDKRPQNAVGLRERILRCRQEVVSAPEGMKFSNELESAKLAEDRYQHYEVLKRADGSLWELGRGAMGVTYKACDTNLRCTVALKVINPVHLQNDTACQQFLREAQATAALRHQNVASMFHLGNDHGHYFYVMEFVDGQNVDEYIKKNGRLEPLTALGIVLQVARALVAVDRQRLVHGDLKPSNLMLVDEDGECLVKVIDFRLVKSLKPEGKNSGRLAGGGIAGTPLYASPEQLEEREIDIRSDIYSLGATLYCMVTGVPPFSGAVAQVMGQHLYKAVPVEPLGKCSGSFVSLVLSMMAKDPNQRIQNPGELRQRIQNCFHELRRADVAASEEAEFGNHKSDEEKPAKGEPPKAASSDPPLRKPRAFLCHSSHDKAMVRELYRQLIRDGFDAWLDEEDLIPGQAWDTEIRRAVRSCDVAVVCLSRSSITKEGYIQKEIRHALDVADEKPAGTIFLIPARLDECDVPERLKHVQWVDLFKDQGYQKLLKALRTR